MEKLTCGYHSCVCRGVSFISRGGVRPDSDYCVNGKRVRLSDDGAVYAYDLTQADVDALSMFLLEEYVAYCVWHVEQTRNRPAIYGDMKLSPFPLGGAAWPLRGRTHSNESGGLQWLTDLFAAAK
jgi:hypothetical protein